MKNKTQAIKQARKEIGQIFQWGSGYKFAVWDETVDAYCEAGPFPYHICMRHRSEALIQIAMQCLGIDPYSVCTPYEGGNWTDYLD